MNLEKVIKGCIENKCSAQKEFYIEYSPKLMAVSLRMSPDNDKAKDLLQDAFIKIFASIHTLENHNPAVVFSWCKRILNFTIIDYYRKTKFERLNVDSIDDDFGSRHGSSHHDYGWKGEISDGLYDDNGDFGNPYHDFSYGDYINEDDSYLASKNVTPEMIIGAIKTLSPQYKLVLNLYLMEGYTHQEIGDTLEISVGTSKSNLSKAKGKMRKELELCQ